MRGIIPIISAAMSTRDLIEEVDAFLQRTGMTQTAFGLRVLNDASFVRRLRQGLDVRLSTVERLRSFMREYEREERAA